MRYRCYMASKKGSRPIRKLAFVDRVKAEGSKTFGFANSMISKTGLDLLLCCTHTHPQDPGFQFFPNDCSANTSPLHSVACGAGWFFSFTLGQVLKRSNVEYKM
ncbi:hypothetical protein TWF225_007188 [Orbilia oligospora]|nr:hypothetical protein TWF225_007188 [Orbilia oligospora]KAF3254195.1 hypothetical protein TWF128_006316 [Orbilia oligospora]KAF3271978.1 hypothetical protein TWF217_003799 [Orbilia oligospora]KAF3287216.1 hypothetical protein TWF132_008587 [Orbilia oligospora]